MPTTSKIEESIFAEALDKGSPEERAAYLDNVCGTDAALRARVENLLRSHEQAGSFLRKPPAATVDEAPGERPGTVIGPYKLLQQIGEGGMGVVYMAEQEQPVRRKVALKIIKPGMDSRQVIARFEVERQALAMMDHQNIAKVFDAGTTETGRPYFVMELVHGVAITKYCDEAKLTPRERLELFVPVCQAIQHAHQKGIIHRDLKPSNILVTMYDDKPVPKVIDFGVAKAVEQRLTEKTMFTQFGALVGTFEYMSPEQAEMNAFGVDTRSDVYSLGVLLYELLTGTTPLERKRLREAALDEMVRLIKEEEPPRPSVRLSTSDTLPKIAAARRTEPDRLSKLVRGEIDWIVMKCLEKDRTRRYESASGLARDIQRHLADEPVEACPPSTGYKLRKFARKYKTPLRVASAFLVLLVLGVVVSTWQAVRATWAERQAQDERDRALAAEQRAKAEKANSQAALAFIREDVLGQASPEKHPNRDLKVRTLLDLTAQRLQKGFDQHPLVEAAIRQTVGAIYKDLGQYLEADQHLSKALEIQLRNLGEEHPDTLTTMNCLGSLYRDQHKHGEADRLFTRTLELRRRVLGEEHPDTLVSRENLAECHIAWWFPERENLEEAERQFAEVLEISRRVHGEEHFRTLLRMGQLAEILARRGKHEEAEALATRAAAHARGVFGNDHVYTGYALWNLTAVYSIRGKWSQVEALVREVLPFYRRQFGDLHPYTLGENRILALAYTQQGRHEEAAPILLQTLEGYRKALGDEDVATVLCQAIWGYNLLQRKKFAEAEPVLRACLAIRQKIQPNTWPLSNTQSLLGGSLLGQKKYAEAEPLLLAGYKGMKEHEKQMPLPAARSNAITHLQVRLAEALERLVQLYDETGKPDEAAKWRKKLEAAKGDQQQPRP